VKKTLNAKITQLLIDKLPELQFIYLFGSQAAGNATKNSDIDIAVFCGKKMDGITRWHIQNELADKLGSEVDLIDLLNTSTVMQHQIIYQGKCIYDPQQKSPAFEMQVISMYQDLNEQRAEILKQYAKV
jgi:predicted nucleotidyltransferase